MKHLDPLDPSARVPDAEPEFEFSKRLVAKVVPYADVQAAQARTWKRLNQNVGSEFTGSASRRVRWQPSVLVAACVLTFVCGVWVGQREQVSGFAQTRVSAEPVAVDQPNDKGIRLAEGPEVVGAQRHGTSSSEAVSPGLDVEAERLSGASKLIAGNTRSRSQGNVALSTVRVQSPVEPALNAVGLPSPSGVEEVVLANPAPGKHSSARPAWHNLANKGEYEAALVEIAQAGGYERVLATASPEQLMLLSDVARATGQQQRALAALGRIVNEHSNDPVAPLAALNMGNLLDKMGDGSGATQAFARYRALSPKGEFAEDALVRQLRSAVKAGQQELALTLVRQYETDFPDGRSAGEVAQLLDQLPDVLPATDAGVPSP